MNRPVRITFWMFMAFWMGLLFVGLATEHCFGQIRNKSVLTYDSVAGRAKYVTKADSAKYADTARYVRGSSGSGSRSSILDTLGKANTYSGRYSFAADSGNTVSGDYSHVEGVGNVSSGYATHTEGMGNTNSGYANHVEGTTNSVTAGYYSHIEGSGNAIVGSVNYVHLEGNNNSVKVQSGHGEGTNNTINAGATTGHVEGESNLVNGAHGHAEGYGTTAGNTAHSQGRGTVASGLASFAAGDSTVAQGYGQTVVGRLNIPQGNNGSPQDSNFVFIVGNGKNNVTSTALAVRMDGVLFMFHVATSAAAVTTGGIYDSLGIIKIKH